MTKAVFISKPSSAYDDLPELRYHFPKTYLRQAREAIGDFIVYYEPRRPNTSLSSSGGRQSYFAVAKVNRIEPDPEIADHFYAYVTDYLEFDRPVPFKEGGKYYETSLRRDDGGTNKGAFGRAVRNLRDEEFDAILRSGFSPGNREWSIASEQDVSAQSGVSEPFADFERPLIESVVTRPFRDSAFKRQIRSAYDNRCAATGLRIINGGGRPEVQAAHIRPVERAGPDSVRNGIALCGTVHWMFDRGLIAIDNDWRILKASSSVPADVERLLNSSGQVNVPKDEALRPHPQFLAYHRQTIFKG